MPISSAGDELIFSRQAGHLDLDELRRRQARTFY